MEQVIECLLVHGVSQQNDQHFIAMSLNVTGTHNTNGSAYIPTLHWLILQIRAAG
jgi:hypothetical protein